MSFPQNDNEDCEIIIEENFGDYDEAFKIIILGYIAVGKSCLLNKVSKDKFSEDYKSTAGFEYSQFVVKVKNKKIRLNIFDITGNESLRNFIKATLNNTNLAILVYSIENKKSFEYIDKVYQELKSQLSSCPNIILVGNKKDLEEKREVTTEEGQKKCDDEDDFKLFLECSAKNGTNVKEVFIEAAKMCYKKGEEGKIILNLEDKKDTDDDKEEEEIINSNNVDDNEKNENKASQEEVKSKKDKKCCDCF